MEVVAGYAERFGVYDRLQPFLANSLGAQESSLFRVVAAYAMFANGGERVEPTLVDRVQDRWGRTVYRHDQRQCIECSEPNLPAGQAPWIASQRQRVMDPITAYQLTSMMQGVVQRGTATRVRLPVPIAGKTGTTNDSRDVWFVGFSSTIVAGCYIGYDRPRSLGRRASGGGTCSPVFSEFMRVAIDVYGGGRFAVPPGGHFIRINRYTGERMDDDASGEEVVAEYFRDGEQPVFGIDALIDGGFVMGASLPVFAPEVENPPLLTEDGIEVGTETGVSSEIIRIPEGSSFGTLSAGGLY